MLPVLFYRELQRSRGALYPTPRLESCSHFWTLAAATISQVVIALTIQIDGCVYPYESGPSTRAWALEQSYSIGVIAIFYCG